MDQLHIFDLKFCLNKTHILKRIKSLDNFIKMLYIILITSFLIANLTPPSNQAPISKKSLCIYHSLFV